MLEMEAVEELAFEEVPQGGDMPYPVGLQRIVCYGGYGMYLVGGATYNGRSDADRLYEAQMFKLNLSTRRWRRLPTADPCAATEEGPPEQRERRRKWEARNAERPILASRCAAFLDERRMLIVGGVLLGKELHSPSCSSYVYDLRDGSSRALPGESPGCGHMDFTDQQLLQCGRGLLLATRASEARSGGRRLRFHRAELQLVDGAPQRLDWRDCSPTDANRPQPPAETCELAVHGDHVYCLERNEAENCVDVSWRYDLNCRHWERVATVGEQGRPPSRLFSCLTALGECAYVVGGSAMTWASRPAQAVLDDIWRLHLPSLRWSRLRVRLPQPLWFHAVDVSPDGYLYIFGGFTDLTGCRPASGLYRLRLDVQPLSTLAWRATLQACRRNLHQLTDEQLRELRIPPCFVAALRW